MEFCVNQEDKTYSKITLGKANEFFSEEHGVLGVTWNFVEDKLVFNLSSTRRTASPTLNCRSLRCHFVRLINVWRYSFWKQLQNCCTNDWMYSNSLRLLFFSVTGPCGAATVTRPRTSRWLGVRGCRSFGSLQGYPNGRLFTRHLTSANTFPSHSRTRSVDQLSISASLSSVSSCFQRLFLDVD